MPPLIQFTSLRRLVACVLLSFSSLLQHQLHMISLLTVHARESTHLSHFEGPTALLCVMENEVYHTVI